MSKKYSWIVEGAKCKWNDPAITDYPKNKRKEVLNRIFTIVGIKSDNGKIDEDTIIEIDGSQHCKEENRTRDELRDSDMQKLGLRVIRYNNIDINRNFDLVCRDILKRLDIDISLCR